MKKKMYGENQEKQRTEHWEGEQSIMLKGAGPCIQIRIEKGPSHSPT